MTDERINVFLDSLESEDDSYAERVYREAKAQGVPVIRRQMKSFLHVALAAAQPKDIIEIGSGVGYSALFMAQCLNEQRSLARICTIEKDPQRAAVARENIARSDYAAKISLIEGDALNVLSRMEQPVDLIFMDAAKGQYIHFLPEVLRLLKPGGMLITDNVLREGEILESRYAVERRDRTIHKRMRQYLYEIKHHPLLMTTIIPLADGVAVSVKKSREEGQFDEEA